jgi:EAL domain-containing protein (putative c-di-GMP-specific phosphodiesterase class I)
MGSFVPELHQMPGSQHDLYALARLWQWERTVRRLLPGVVAEGGVGAVFQPVLGLHGGVPRIRGYEALARFPVAAGVPVGLWFRVASDMGLAYDLELAAAQKAVDGSPRMLAESLLFLNASLTVAVDLAGEMVPQVPSRLVIDTPYLGMDDRGGTAVIDRLRGLGALVAVDDVPVRGLPAARPTLTGLRPDYVKVDVITGLDDDPMARVDLAEAVIWCEEWGTTVIAERVEKVTDVQILYDLGVRFV